RYQKTTSSDVLLRCLCPRELMTMKTEVSAAPSKSAAVMDFLQLWRLFTASAAVDAALTKFLHDDTFGERLVKQCDEILDFLDKKATSPLIDILALANAMLNIYVTV